MITVIYLLISAILLMAGVALVLKLNLISSCRSTEQFFTTLGLIFGIGIACFHAFQSKNIINPLIAFAPFGMYTIYVSYLSRTEIKNKIGAYLGSLIFIAAPSLNFALYFYNQNFNGALGSSMAIIYFISQPVLALPLALIGAQVGKKYFRSDAQ